MGQCVRLGGWAVGTNHMLPSGYWPTGHVCLQPASQL